MTDHATIRSYRVTVLLVDIAATVLAVPAAMGLLALLSLPSTGVQFGALLWVVLVASMLLGIWSMRGYDLDRIFRITDEVTMVVLGALVGTGIFAGSLFFLGLSLPRLLVASIALLAPLFALALRLGSRMFYRWRQVPRVPTLRVLIVGTGPLGREVGQELQERAWLGIEVVGTVGEEPQNGSTLGALPELESMIARERVDVVVVTAPLEAHGDLGPLMERIHKLPVQVKLVPELFPLAYLYSRLEMFGGRPLIGISDPLISPWQRAVKRVIDVTLALIALLAVSPLLAFIALGVRLTSPGPIIFRQERVGQDGRLFNMYKFRTMVSGAEQMLLEQAREDPALLIKRSGDPRVTGFGSWLRRFSLDELPQLWNVLRGDMSMVGPRPELPYLVERYEPWQRKRLLVPQGVTGWWQINGRSEKPMLLHTEDDMYYIRNYSLLLDLEILWKTIWVVLRGKGAY